VQGREDFLILAFINHRIKPGLVLALLWLFLSNMTILAVTPVSRTFQGFKSDFDRILVSENFNIFFSQELREEALWLFDHCAPVMSDMENFLDYRINGKIELVLTPVSNIDKSRDVKGIERDLSSGGVTKVDHKRIMVFYEGHYSGVIRQLRQGLAHVLVNEMLYGVSITEKVKNNLNTSFPDWYVHGLIAYLSEGWTIEDEQVLRDKILYSGKNYLQKDKVTPSMNKAHWYFLEKTRGKSAVSRLIYLTRLTRSIESSLYFVMNKGYRDFYGDMEAFFIKRYISEPQRFSPGFPEILPKAIQKLEYISFAVAGDRVMIAGMKGSTLLVFVSQNGAEWKQMMRLTEIRSFKLTSDRKRSFVLCSREVGESWKLKRIRFNTDIKSGWTSESLHMPDSIQQISDVHMINHNRFLISAAIANRFDVFEWNASTDSLLYWTNNAHYEKELCVDDKGGVFVLQEMIVGKALEQKTNLLYYDKPSAEPRIIQSFGNQGVSDLIYVEAEGEGRLHFLSDINGIRNAYSLQGGLQEVIALTDYSRNIRGHTFGMEGDLYELMMKDGNWLLIRSVLEGEALSFMPKYTNWRMEVNLESDATQKQETSDDQEKTGKEQEKAIFYFQNDFPEDSSQIFMDTFTESYHLTYREYPLNGTSLILRRIYTKLDNSLLGVEKQSALMSPQLHYQYPLRFMGGLQMSNALDQQRFEMILRLESQLNGSDQLLRYFYRHKKIDWGAEWYRWAFRRGAFLQDYNRFSTNMIAVSATYLPVNLRLSLHSRWDQRRILVTDENSLLNGEQERTVLRSLQLGWNKCKGGLSHGLWTYSLQSEIGIANSNGQNRSFAQTTGELHYRRQKKQALILGIDAFAGTSYGGERTVFFLGAPNQLLNQSWRGDMAYVEEQALWWQHVPSLRAMPQNSRNGHTFLAYRTDLNWYPFRELNKRPVLKGFYRHFALGVFQDGGVAWYGVTPYDSKNPYFITNISQPGLQIRLYQRKNPFVFSGGFQSSVQIFRFNVHWFAGMGLENRELTVWRHQFVLGYSI
jgi:hypothetical protein